MSSIGKSPTRLPSGRRLQGLIVGIMTFAGLAYFIVATASLTHAAFSGCWLSCGGDPALAWGVLWAVVTAALLATPIAIGLHIARVRSRIAWATAALVVLLMVAAWVLFSLDPDNADFFVSLDADGGRLPISTAVNGTVPGEGS